MKRFALLSFLLSITYGLCGCGSPENNSVPQVNNDMSLDQATLQKERPRHGDHKHAFQDPAECAKKWNASDRDEWQHPEAIIAALELKPGAMVAEIGAGTGYMVSHLSKSVGESGTVIAIDASSAMIAFLEKHSAEMPPAKVVARKVPRGDPELAGACLDGVLMLDTWHHVEDRESYAEKVYEGLKPGGRFVVVDFEVDAAAGPPKSMRLTPEQVGSQLKAAGFRTEILPNSMPRHYLVVGHRD
ncbi:class I SAM-dependent methyltransferase [Schlesneria sp. T3-172]|uniref:class I SAM-dependent methyltransferase n=1 Tax=Schlesneria sphaerica TaxID=3373610 RepID=UPI0037CAD439